MVYCEKCGKESKGTGLIEAHVGACAKCKGKMIGKVQRILNLFYFARSEGNQTAFRDLLGDMKHYADKRRIDFDYEVERADAYFQAESAVEAIKVEDPITSIMSELGFTVVDTGGGCKAFQALEKSSDGCLDLIHRITDLYGCCLPTDLDDPIISGWYNPETGDLDCNDTGPSEVEYRSLRAYLKEVYGKNV